ALSTVLDEPSSAVASPALMGATGVVPLTVVSVIPDIMQHYHDTIAAARSEVLLATNAWEKGKSVDLVTSGIRALEERCANEGRTVTFKLLVDAASLRNAISPRYYRTSSHWEEFGLPTEAEIPHIKLEVINYHIPPLGTFHSKFMVVDRQIALVNSNNVNIRSNVEMMCRFEGDIVNGLWDTFIISWSKPMAMLPCLHTPTTSKREFRFGAQNIVGGPTLEHGGPDAEGKSQATFAGAAKGQFDHVSEHSRTPTLQLVNERLNVFKPAEASSDLTDADVADFAPFFFHDAHTPVPMALVNRRPYPVPGHSDLATPQNAAWLAAIALAKDHVFIQSPVFSAHPAVEAVLAACRRGVHVTLYVDDGFNDFAEGVVPFQGGTNDAVRDEMYDELKKTGHEQFLEYAWYTAKDQSAPLGFDSNQRNCHVKFLAVDGQVAVMGSGNMDTQSWYHSQEVNVMVDSPSLVAEWKEIFARNQNTAKLGKTLLDGKLASGKELPKKSGHGGLKRSEGGFL
ncbi:phospholipase D/nuclease, partial [Exidia glandulosa HHB12029]